VLLHFPHLNGLSFVSVKDGVSTYDKVDGKRRADSGGDFVRERSCRLVYVSISSASSIHDRLSHLRCSLLLNARAQYWHLYFFSGPDAEFFFGEVLVLVGAVETSVAIGAVNKRSQVLRPRTSLSLESNEMDTGGVRCSHAGLLQNAQLRGGVAGRLRLR